MAVISRSAYYGRGSRRQSGGEKSYAIALTSLGCGGNGSGRHGTGRSGRIGGAESRRPPFSTSSGDATSFIVWCLTIKTKKGAASGPFRQIAHGGLTSPCRGRSTVRRRIAIDGVKGVGPIAALGDAGERAEVRTNSAISTAFKGPTWSRGRRLCNGPFPFIATTAFIAVSAADVIGMTEGENGGQDSGHGGGAASMTMAAVSRSTIRTGLVSEKPDSSSGRTCTTFRNYAVSVMAIMGAAAKHFSIPPSAFPIRDLRHLQQNVCRAAAA